MIRTFSCAARRVVNGNSGIFLSVLIHAGIFRKTGLVRTWGEGCPRRLRLASGDIRSASDSADRDRWATTGQRSTGSGRLLRGGPASIVGPHVGQRPATFACCVQRHGYCGRHQAPLGGVQPHLMKGAAERPCRRPADNALGVASSNAGKAAAFSRVALQIRRASVVTSAKRTARRSKRASDDARPGNRTPSQVVDRQGWLRILDGAQWVVWSGADRCQIETGRFLQDIFRRSDDRSFRQRFRREARFLGCGTLNCGVL